jgi:hypothetical protein
MECRTGGDKDTPVTEKRFGLGHERGGRLQAQGFVPHEVAQDLALGRPKGPKAQRQLEELLMLRDGLTPLGILLDQRGIEGDLLGDKDQQVIEEFQGLLRRKTAGQPEEPQLIGEAQPVMRAATLGDLGVVSGGKPDAVGDEVTGIVHRMEHGRVLLR